MHREKGAEHTGNPVIKFAHDGCNLREKSGIGNLAVVAALIRFDDSIVIVEGLWDFAGLVICLKPLRQVITLQAQV